MIAARHGSAGRAGAKHGKDSWRGKAMRGEAWYQGMAGPGLARQGRAWDCGTARLGHGMARDQGAARPCKALRGPAWRG